jgi:O-antigen ligase
VGDYRYTMPGFRPAFAQASDGGWRAWLAAWMAWTLIVLMIAPDNFDYLALKINDATPTEGSWVSRTLWIALLVAGVVLMLSRAALTWQLIRAMNPFLLLFSALAIASVTWSIEPEVTARRGIRVITFFCDAVALGVAGWHAHRFQSVVRPAITAMLAGSIVFGLTNPELAIHTENSPELIGAWHGLASHKNMLGALSCMGVIFWMHAWLSRQAPVWRVLIGLAIAGTCLVLSRSSTSMLVTLLAISFLALQQRGPAALRPYMPVLIILFVCTLLLYSGVILDVVPGSEFLLKPITHFAGKDKSFTGRSDIWNLVMEHIRYHRLLGTGLGAYWTGPFLGKASYVFIERLQFYPYSAHNGYLEIVNDLGFAGLFCLGGFLWVYLKQALQLGKTDHMQASLYLALFLQQGFINLSESHWLSVLSVGNVVICFATASLARAMLDQRALLAQQRVRQSVAMKGNPQVAHASRA